MPEYADIDKAALQQMHLSITSLKDVVLAHLLKSPETKLPQMLVGEMKTVLAQAESMDLPGKLQAVHWASMEATYKQAVGIIDGILADEGLADILNVPPETIETIQDYVHKPSKIKTLTGSYLKLAQTEVSIGFLGQRSPAMVARRIMKATSNMIWQAERIVRTENKRIANHATQARIGKVAAAAKDIGIPMRKVWLHASVGASAPFPGKYKPRPHHKAMHGVSVLETESFKLSNPVTGQAWAINGPHDDKLPAGETVNCYCNVSLRIDRDEYKKRREEALANKAKDPELYPPDDVKTKDALAKWYADQTGTQEWAFKVMSGDTLKNLKGLKKSAVLEQASLSKKAHAEKYGKGKKLAPPPPPPPEPEVPKFPAKLLGNKEQLVQTMVDETGLPAWMFKVASKDELLSLAGKPKSAAVDLAMAAKKHHAEKYAKTAKEKAAAPKVIPKEQPPLMPPAPDGAKGKVALVEHFAEQTGAPAWAFKSMSWEDLTALVGKPKSAAIEAAFEAKLAHKEKYGKKSAASKPKPPKPKPDTAPSAKAKDPAALAQAAAVGQTKPPPAVDADGFPESPQGLVLKKGLGGSTGAELVEDPSTGKLFVRKMGASEEHVTSEYIADRLYQAGGANVPKAKLYKTPSGASVKLAEYVDDAEVLGKVIGARRERVAEAIKKDFVLDCLLGNWDVAGLGNDNILVKGDTPYRIDNGGSLRFRAQGAKKLPAEFGAVVLELETLRDPNVNINTAALFKDITDDEIKEQVVRLNKNKAALLEIANEYDLDLAKTLEARIEFMTKRYAPELLKPKPAASPKAAGKAAAALIDKRLDAEVKRAVPGDKRSIRLSLDEKLHEDVLDARSNGIAVAIDRDFVEEGQVLIWEETNRFGEKVLRCEFKLTLEGQTAVLDTMRKNGLVSDATLKDLNKKAASKVELLDLLPKEEISAIHQKNEDLAETFIAAAKTINHHHDKGDTDYNSGAISKFKKELQEVSKWKPKTSEEKELKAYYQEVGVQMLESMNNPSKPKVPTIQLVPLKSPRVLKSAEPIANVPYFTTEFYGKDDSPLQSVERLEFYKKRSEKGRLVEIKEHNVDAKTRAIHLRGETVNIRMQPARDSKGELFNVHSAVKDGVQQVYIGFTDISIKGGATQENIAKLRDAFERMGVPTRTQSPDYLKALVLRRQFAYDGDPGTYGERASAIMSDPAITDAERLKQMKALTVKYGGNPNVEDRHLPRANSFGHGFAPMRLPMLDEIVSKNGRDTLAEENITVIHSTYDLRRLVRGVVESGGWFTNTRQRMRKGVDIGATGGMSAESDLGTGGADYIFTRIQTTGSGRNVHGLEFYPDILARADSFSYDGDRFGDTRGLRGDSRSFRTYTMKGLNGWKTARKVYGNETMFKNGMFLFDDVKHIRCGSEQERNDIILYLKQEGYDKWPDGRKLEEVVRLQGE